jgi:2-polyprenyl-3-methyl-5-hydroxy-6-metoxy-1,4-benzoquinol methylase
VNRASPQSRKWKGGLQTASQPIWVAVPELCWSNSSILVFDLHGLEVSQLRVAQGQKAHPGIQLSFADFTSDISSHPLGGKRDVVIRAEVVEDVFLPRIFATNCGRMMKPRGRFSVSTPYNGYLENVALAVTAKLGHSTALWDFGHVKFWPRRTLTELLKESVFEVERFHCIDRLPFLWRPLVLVDRKP